LGRVASGARWKLSFKDFRNRDRWKDYEMAIEEMIGRTSTKWAPWYLVPANNKPFAWTAALNILADQLGKGATLELRLLDAKTEWPHHSCSATQVTRFSLPTVSEINIRRS
jgi:hypothetical protein